MNKKALTILSVGHLVADLNQGALPALLPFFKETLSLSYTVTGVIILVFNLVSSVIQPLFGYLSDKRPMGWFLPLSPFIACLGMSATGLIPHFYLILLCVIVSGLGIASYHPEGFKTAHFFTGEKKATGMSLFSVGGNFGVSLGPLLAITLVTHFGLKGTLGLVLPGIVMSLFLFRSIRWLTSPVLSAFKQRDKETQPLFSKANAGPLFLLNGIVIMRTWTYFGLMTYIPFYYIDYLKGDVFYAGKLVSTFLVAGAVGTLIGAPLADAWGHKKYLTFAQVSMVPLLLLFYTTRGPMLFLILALAGMMLISTFTTTIVMAQTFLPHHLGIASGLMTGFAFGTGGIGVTLLGWIADHWGVPVAIKSIILLPIVGFLLSLLLKVPVKKEE
jgi:MFS transporter, FSR family, fosmidomycin resistance protein